MSGLSVAEVLQRELGAPNATAPTGYRGGYEETPELRWPYNQVVYDRMRKTWSQGQALLKAVTMPALGTRWGLRGADVRPEVLELCTRELGLFQDSEGRRRARDGGLIWDDFLRMALLHGPLGFMPFEIVTAPGPPDPGSNTGLGVVQHLVDLSPRFPRTLVDLIVEPDGRFGGVRQYVFRPDPRIPGSVASWQIVPIPAATLVMFVNEREGADWYGQSWLRPAYKHWLITDMLYRVGALSVDRTGMGLPVVTYPKDQPGAKREALALASAIRAGEDAGVALEEGWTVELVGVQGTVADSVPLIALHDQAAGRGMLEMFMNLGHDRGSQSLGETFVDYFLMSERALLRYVEEVVTEQVIRRLVTWNYGPDEPYPALVADDPTVNPLAVATAMGLLANAGLIYTDSGVRNEIRERLNLPVEGPDAISAVKATAGAGGPADPGSTAGAPGTPRPGGLPTVLDRAGRNIAEGATVGAGVAGGIHTGTVTQVAAAAGHPGAGVVTVIFPGGRTEHVPSHQVQVVHDPRLLTGAQLAAHARALADRLETAVA